jgi:hypothetical protein
MSLSLDGTTGISASGNITGGNVIASGSLIVGSFTPSSLSTTGNVTGGNVLTGGLVSATANVTGGNVLTGGLISATGNITGGNVLGGANVNATTHTGSTVSVTANITGGNLLTGGLISATSTITSAANITGGNVLTSGLISATGAITGGSLTVGTGTITGGNIVNSNANGVGNIGSSTTYFNTVFAKATSAQYADLAEMYVSDTFYAPGTVVEFGGDAEITQSSRSHGSQVAGIISTNPSYLMNATQEGSYVLAVALVGRVPCQVVGTIRKGDRLVAAGHPGVATVLDMTQYQPGCIIGKALESYDSEEIGTIEVAVGRT